MSFGEWSDNPGREEPHPSLKAIAERARRAETPCGTGSLVWRAWGQGRPLVLLHGGSGSWRHWMRNIPVFSAGRMVICADLPGLGDSDMPPDGATPATIGDILRDGLAMLLRAGQGYDLVGFSFGALCAGHLAAADRDNCRSLTVVGAGALGLPRSPTELLKVRHLEGTAREEAHLVIRDAGGPAFGGTPSDASVIRAIQEMKARGLQVMFHPFVLMDIPAGNVKPDPYGAAEQAAYPWRGRMTCSTAPERPGSPCFAVVAVHPTSMGDLNLLLVREDVAE